MDEPYLQSPLFFRKDQVLTENTDDFIVGDRVWVNGTKPGYIQYLGETNFASGDWAGVVLDDPIGKNDGSLAGKRYFYCEPKRGVFARLTRLTRYPLSGKESPDSGIYRESSPSPKLNGILRNSSQSPIPSSGYKGVTMNGTIYNRNKSPTRFSTVTSVQLREKSPSRSMSPCSGRDSQNSNSYMLPSRPTKTTTMVTTTTTTLDGTYRTGPLRVGDKIFVNSTKGVLAGKLRYLGKTDFAPGLWAGVELDSPSGKNDGSVAGKRYFACPKNRGLFAPTYKVVKADPKRMTTITRVTRASPEI